jgi:hypothetical protein
MEKLTAGGRTNAGNDVSRIEMVSGGATTEGARITPLRASANRTGAEVPTVRAGAGSVRRVVSLVPFSQPAKDGR